MRGGFLKKGFIIFLITVIFLEFSVVANAEISVSAHSAVVICKDSADIVFSKNASEQLPIASTTKIMTAVLAIESGRLNETVTVGDEVCEVDGTSLGLEKGDSIDLYSLVLGMMLSSGNDAANAIAVFVGKTIENFTDMMNAKAQEIGMTNSSFVTPSGLDADNHYSTALDLAYLARYAMNLPIFCEIVRTQSARLELKNGKILYVSNHNKLLSMYNGCIGIKTGFTKSSGRCLVSAVERNSVLLIAVTLNASDDWNDHIKMYDYSFEQVHLYEENISSFPQISVVGGEEKFVSLELSNALTYSAICEAEDTVVEICVPAFVYAPVSENDVLGEVRFTKGGDIIATSVLLAQTDVDMIQPQDEPALFEKIKNILTGWFRKWKN